MDLIKNIVDQLIQLHKIDLDIKNKFECLQNEYIFYKNLLDDSNKILQNIMMLNNIHDGG